MRSTTDLALFLVRVGLALVFMAHGWDKVSDMNGAMGTVHMFASLGLPAFLAYAVGYIELIGGFFMLIGFWTGWTAVALAAIMVGSISIVKISKGFLGGFEFDLMLFLSAIAVALAGPGAYTIKQVFRKRG